MKYRYPFVTAGDAQCAALFVGEWISPVGGTVEVKGSTLFVILAGEHSPGDLGNLRLFRFDARYDDAGNALAAA
jgi:hypothetical protein